MTIHSLIAPYLTLSALCYAVAYAAAAGAFVWMAKKRRLLTPGVLSLLGAGLIGGLVFAHIGQWLTGDPDGKTIIGAIAGGYLTVHVYKRRIGLKRPTGDLFAVALCVGEAIGRWGCFFGGCCYGKPSSVPWAVYQHGAYRHPTQIYLSLASLITLGILWRFSRTSPPENALFYLQGVLFCVFRFVVEFWRDTPASFYGLSTAQWACISGFVFFSTMFSRLMWWPVGKAQQSVQSLAEVS